MHVIYSVQNPVQGVDQSQLQIYAPNGTLVVNQAGPLSYDQDAYFVNRADGKGNYTIIVTYDNSLTAKLALPSWINNDPVIGFENVAENSDGSVIIQGRVDNGLSGEQVSIAILDSNKSTRATYTVDGNTHDIFELDIDSTTAKQIFTQSGSYTIVVTHLATGVQGQTVLTYNTPSTTSTVITVRAISSGSVLHMYTLLKTPAGVTLTTGFTPVGFTVNANTDYLIKVSNYSTHVFQYWQDQPSNTNPVRPINISQDTTIVAIFS